MKLQGRVVALLIAFSIIIGGTATYFLMSFFDGNAKVSLISSNEAKGTGVVTKEDVDKIAGAMELIAGSYIEEIDKQQLVEGAIQGMVNTLEDPYSVYMDEETAKQFSESLESSFEGIGAEVSMVDGKVTIVAPFKGSPAEKAGLKPNDQVLEVDGESLAGLDLYEAVLKIRGEKGSKVTLLVQRPGMETAMEIEVIRDEIPIETVYSSMKEYDGKKVGYIEITSFSEDTAKDFIADLAELEKNGMDGLIIDVRGNPGGYLQSVEEIVKELIPKDKPYMQIEMRNGQKQRYFSALEKKKDYPIVALIDNGSASASEILAGALQEAGGYPLVGVNTFGKGTVQQTIPLGRDGSQMKLTLYKWLTPNGNWIHETGITPTVEVKQPDYFYANPIQIDEEAYGFDDNNNQIKNAQLMLNGLGFSTGRADGYFSKETETAIQAFQRAHHLDVTGKLDKETAAMLQSRIIDMALQEENDVQLKAAMKLLFQ